MQETTEFGGFGDEIVVDAVEQMRLGSIGALGPVGCSREDLENEFNARVEAYRSQRRGFGEAA